MSLISDELRAAVSDFFAKNLYNGYQQPFVLVTIVISPLNPSYFYAIPENIEEEIYNDQDQEWERKLFELGKKFGVNLVLPHWCYGK